jgi:hypothetical protein
MVTRRAASRGYPNAKRSQADQRERLNNQEVNQGEDGGENHVQPPPPPAVDLAHVMANQTLLLEAIANAINRSRTCWGYPKIRMGSPDTRDSTVGTFRHSNDARGDKESPQRLLKPQKL